MKAELKHIHPVLPVKSVENAVNYYVSKLGFSLVFKDSKKSPNYAGVTRDHIEIHLQWHDENEWKQGVVRPLLRFYVQEVDLLFEEYSRVSVFHKHTKLRDTAWGTREFAFYDPDSNGLVFYRDL